MKDDITQSDGFADGVLLVSAASYPVVRGAGRMIGGAIDNSRRSALIARGELLTRSAAEIVPLVRPKLQAIDAALQGVGMEGVPGGVFKVMAQLEDRVRWFSPSNIREFVESNEVDSLILCKELGEFLASPVRVAIDATREALSSKNTGNLQAQLRDLELALIKFAAEKLEADISRAHEPSHLLRSWFAKAARIGAILLLGTLGLLAIAFLTIN